MKDKATLSSLSPTKWTHVRRRSKTPETEQLRSLSASSSNASGSLRSRSTVIIMMTGSDLLEKARAASPDELHQMFGPDSGESGDAARAAAVATLLTSRSPSDVPLIRELTRFEMERRAAGAGFDDGLLACCYLLFMTGKAPEGALVWEAKELDFDSHCYIDSGFLIPEGIDATIRFATENGIDDLLAWVRAYSPEGLNDQAESWRTFDYFGRVPPPSSPVEMLTKWWSSG